MSILEKVRISLYLDIFQMTARAAATAAATTSQELSLLAGLLDHHAQGPNIPFGESLTSILYPAKLWNAIKRFF